MPMMPMDPAKEVMRVRPFFVIRLLADRDRAVRKPIEVRRAGLASRRSCAVGTKGSESATMQPSASSTMRVAYSWASSGLCVTMMTRRSRATSRSRSMTCTLVLESRAPVGSSASRISGSLMRARAMATRCIWPPDICEGFLWTWSFRPTRSRASRARLRRSERDTPDRVSASSTFARTLWCGIRL